MFRKDDLDTLRGKLDFVNVEIDNHPYNSEEVRASNEIIENSKKEKKTASDINLELSLRGLPSLEQGGQTILKGMRSFAKLHRTRVRLEKRINKLGRRGLP